MILTELTRREFLKLGAGIAASASVPNFAYAMERPPADVMMWSVIPTIERSFIDHVHADPRGIDFQAGHGAPTSASIEGWYLQAGKRADGSTGVDIEGDLGHKVVSVGQDEVYVQPGQRAHPFQHTGPEGTGAPRVSGSMEEHLHVGLALVVFAIEFFRNKDELFPHTDSYSGVTRPWVDPDKHSFASLTNPNGKLTDSWFNGDTSHQKKLLEEAVKRFESIEAKHPDSFMAKYIRWSREENIRFFPRTLVAYQLWKDNLLEKEVAETVKEYLHWHSNVNIGMFLPYPNPKLKDRYVRPTDGPERIVRLKALWADVAESYKSRNWDKAIAKVNEYRSMAPMGVFDFGGEGWQERTLGLSYRWKGNYEKATLHLLTAWGLSIHHPPKQHEKNLYLHHVYGKLARSFAAIGNYEMRSHFLEKFKNTPSK